MVEVSKDGLTVIEAARRIYRALEMSAGIMRDRKRTGGWEGAERTADAFARQAIDAKTLHDRLATLQAERDRYRVAAIRAALCLSGYIGEGIFVEDHEYPEDVYDNICVALGSPNADDDELRTALSDTPTVQS